MKKTLKDTIIPTLNSNPVKGKEIIRGWKKNKRPTSASLSLRPGNIVFVKTYHATTIPQWDRNPVILIFNTSSSYVLGFNINWMSKAQKKKTIRLITKEVVTAKGKAPNRAKMLSIFKKMRRMDFPKPAIRVYFRSELSKSMLYRLSIGEFYEAISHNLISLSD